MEVSWLKQDGTSVKLMIQVQPSAKKTAIDCVFNDRLKIKIASPPVDGKANETLIKYLSKLLGLKKKDISISIGEASKLKTVVLNECQKDDIYTLILPLIS